MIRQRELDRVKAILEQNSGAAVIGGIGFGRSSLLRALERDWVGKVVWVPFNRSEAATRFSGLEILLAAMSVLDAEAFDFWDESSPEGMSEPEASEWVSAAFRQARIPDNTLIVIPDADGMDTSSQVVLGQIVRRLRTGRLQIAVTARPVPEESPLSGMPSIELRPLDSTAMTEFAYDLTSGHIAEEVVQFSTQIASGRPLALRLILAQMTPSQRLGRAALPMPVRVGRAVDPMVREIVGGPDPEADAVLKLLAAAPLTPFRPLRKQFPQLWEHVEDLESRGVLERRGPYIFIAQGIVRASVHAQMGAGERLALHERLEQLCADSTSALSDWHASFSTFDGADGLADAGLGLLAQGYPEAGVEFIERAIRLSSDIGSIGQSLLDVAESLYARGDLAFASRYVRILSTTGDLGLMVRARALDVEIEFAQHQQVPSRLLDSWTKAELDGAPDAVARLQLVLSQCHLERREYAEAQQLLRAASSLQERFGPREQQLYDGARLRLDCSRGNDELALQKFAELGEREVDSVDPNYLLSIASGLLITEHYESALAVLDRLRSRHGRETIWWTSAMYLQAETAIRSGRISVAVETIETVNSLVGANPPIRSDRWLMLKCWSLLAQGLASDAEPVEMQLAAHAASTHNRDLIASLNAVQGSYLLRAGYPADASRHLLRCQELSANTGNANIHRYESDLIEALMRVGRREHASLVFQQLKKKVERAESRWGELALSRCEAMLTAGDKSVELFLRVLRAWTSQDSQFERALTHEALSRRLAELGSHSQSREHSNIAGTLYSEVGADHLVEARLGAEGRESVQETPQLPELLGLNEEELKVVELVRAGMKNRDIARRVFVSLRTVELRLTSVYRKFDVASRTELVARLAGSPRLAAV